MTPSPLDKRKEPSARTAAAIVLGLAALGALVFGYGFHTRVVLVETEVEAPPDDEGPDAFEGFPFPVFDEQGQPVTFPEDEVETPTETERVEEIFREPILVRDVTVGGLVRLDDGRLMRTYTGKPPQACPT